MICHPNKERENKPSTQATIRNKGYPSAFVEKYRHPKICLPLGGCLDFAPSGENAGLLHSVACGCEEVRATLAAHQAERGAPCRAN